VTKGTIFRIERFAVHDGPGIRTTVFLKGCPIACAWCHSPESQALASEFMPLADRCVQCGACAAACPHGAIDVLKLATAPMPADCDRCGACARACPSGARELVGRAVTAADIVEAVEPDRIFYEQSGGGVTFSGGEPLMQPEFLIEVIRQCKALGVHAAVDTSGYCGRSDLLRVAELADLVLFDLKILDDRRHLAFTGVSNRLILDNLRALSEWARNVIVRFPLVPGVTDDEANVRSLGALVASLGLRRVDVLPYHRAGIAKYRRLNRAYALEAVQPPSQEARDTVARALGGFGLTVTVGGSS